MGFSGGGSNVLLPHKHDGTVAQDGGPLDFDNVTQGDLTAGDVVFSDGVHLQRLAIGTPAQQIQVNAGATAPEYFTPAAASAVYEEIASTTLGADADNITLTFPAVSGSDVAQFVFITNGALSSVNEELAVQINGHTAANSYKMQRLNVQNGVTSSTTHTDNYWKPYGLVPGDAGRFFGRMFIQVDNANVVADTQNPNVMMQCNFTATDYNLLYSGIIDSAGAGGLVATSLTEVKLFTLNGNDIKAGSAASLFKVNI